ncbi:MAG: DEAD/DEAH box helicase [bacterium]
MKTFEETGLNNEVIQAVTEMGFEIPTPIQEQTIPQLLNSGKDLIALAQTGTGKTAAFGLPIIQMTDTTSKNTQTLVLCPTRELCMQITKDIKTYSKYTKNLFVVPVYGGTSIDTQINALKNGKQIVVGTPGRVVDLINRKKLILSDIRWLVLDEADEMLSMGFKDDLNTILAETPEERQTLLFSATMSSEIKSITKKYMKKADEITIGHKNAGAENVTHQYISVQSRDKYEALKRIADINPDIYGIVFCRTRNETKVIAEKLIQDGYNADALHGDLSQVQRDQVMNRFRVKHLQILVATDVAARGLDVNDLTHIINYDMPDELGIYIHRSGRTGRAGKNGISISLINTREKGNIRSLENMIGKKFEQKNIPSGKDICQKQLFNMIDKVENVAVEEEQIAQFLPGIYNKLSWMTREELIQHFVSVEFNQLLSYYNSKPDINVASLDDKGGKRSNGRKSFSRFYFNIGSKNDINATRIIGIINEKLRSRDVQIGKIEILKKFSFVEIESSYEIDMINAFDNAKFEREPLTVELVKDRQMDSKRTFDNKKERYSDRKPRKYSDRREDSFASLRKRKRK